MNTKAQFGFTNTLVELINKEKPTHVAVCFGELILEAAPISLELIGRLIFTTNK